MPSAQQTIQDPPITYTDDQLKSLQQDVAGNLRQAGVNASFEAIKPSHVPDERPKNVVDEVKVKTENSIPGSFNSTPETALSPLKALSEHLDFADQIVTGRTHIIDEAQRFSAHKVEKENKRMKFENNPNKNPRGPVKMFVDWLHDA